MDPVCMVKPDAILGDPNGFFGHLIQNDPQGINTLTLVGFPPAQNIQMAESTVNNFKEIGPGAFFFSVEISGSDITSLYQGSGGSPTRRFESR